MSMYNDKCDTCKVYSALKDCPVCNGMECASCLAIHASEAPDLNSVLAIIGNYGKKYVAPMWMKEILEGAGLIDVFGDLVDIREELADLEDNHFRMYHDD